ncbi:hypothetical protein MLP_22370 [Microlunatus phosphovorus NM-1]|uniref:Polymerase nucleotidyl transferase domain-containing protein n=1 Tax=Microlunatus phosphovorus (strain ATCC 700054 / DSM 10555 / JCM 9379 / NBRC 101784 / NCIMB 13414 / VKM Ac-1990 / NM-1) TaxID=1032480 RepID=F5XEN5_MICPN|nr:nucleotidyltransferase [Microlunatus phosphovorus]BAK35251.1 hypothetical protein MLP_22370 [Microlunatus phosphovorus NM-1]
MTVGAVRTRGGSLSGLIGRLVVAHRSELREVLLRHGIAHAQVFGSVARGDDHAGSDVDILVELPPETGLFGIARVQAELESILGADVDLVPAVGLKPLVRAHLKPDLVDL